MRKKNFAIQSHLHGFPYKSTLAWLVFQKRTVFVFTESWSRDQVMQRAYWGCKSEVTGVLRPTLSNSHPASKSGLILSLSTVLVRSWACPRPERFPTPCYQVLNNNTQSRKLHNVIHCCRRICPIKAICDWQVLANHIRGRQPDQNPKQALRAQIL